VRLLLELALTAAATVAMRAEDTAAEGVLVNTGTEPAEVDLVELTSPSLALEVVDDQGRPVLMPPPPTPGRPEMVVLAPGGRRSVPFRAFVPRRRRRAAIECGSATAMRARAGSTSRSPRRAPHT